MESCAFKRLAFLCISLVCLFFSPSYAQQSGENLTELQMKATKVFLDMSSYQEYIKTEITFVNYVRDRKEAQVYIMLTQQETGSGGDEYTLTFIGHQNYAGMDDTLKCVSQQMDSEETIRRNIVRTMKMGLVRYVSKTPLARDLFIEYRPRTSPAEVVDKWNYWVFSIDTDSEYNAERSSKEIMLDGTFSANRVTPFWKISLAVSADYNNEEYKVDNSTISSYTRSREFEGLIVKSYGDHWSTGVYCSSRSSVFSNTKYSWNVAPAIEFNIFPYSESTRRELRILYRAGYTDIRYHEATIFDKIHDNLFDENISGTFEIKEKWGSISTTMEGSHYFHDFKKNRLRLHSNINLRIFEGFSLNLHGNVTRIHDQLSLPREDATEEEILLHKRELATQYDYYLSIGFRYTFGSIFSNVVNPRFGND